jgi:ADP-ribose pyrophosphatase YjhB (NUDIX family)
MFSEVQVQILTKLLKSQAGLRYSQAQPDDEFVDNDLYNYHLQFLVKKGFVQKVDQLYQLTPAGKQAVHHFDVTGKLYEAFKVSVLAFVTREVNNQQEVLLQKRTRHPYLGDTGVISGKINPGEPIEDAAKRKLAEETGFTADFQLLGVYRTARKDKEGQIIEDTFFHACHADKFSGQLIKDSKFGHNFWASFDKAIKLQQKNLTASKNLEEIFKRIQKGDLSLFYFQEVLLLGKY